MEEISVKENSELTSEEIYNILHLRSEVFVVEQKCIYQDIDYKDKQAIHVFIKKEKKIIAYSRVFNKGNYFKESSIGRIVVSKKYRKKGYGEKIMKLSIDLIEKKFKEKKIKISAQTYLKKFYRKFNFIDIGNEYLEDGIPHIKMIKN